MSVALAEIERGAGGLFGLALVVAVEAGGGVGGVARGPCPLPLPLPCLRQEASPNNELFGVSGG